MERTRRWRERARHGRGSMTHFPSKRLEPVSAGRAPVLPGRLRISLCCYLTTRYRRCVTVGVAMTRIRSSEKQEPHADSSDLPEDWPSALPVTCSRHRSFHSVSPPPEVPVPGLPPRVAAEPPGLWCEGKPGLRAMFSSLVTVARPSSTGSLLVLLAFRLRWN
jgi:hypothetical protein